MWDKNNVTIEFVHDDLENYDISDKKWGGIFSHIAEQLQYDTGGPPSKSLL